MTQTSLTILHNKIDSVCRTIAIYEQVAALKSAKGEALDAFQQERLASLYESVKHDLRRIVKHETTACGA